MGNKIMKIAYAAFIALLTIGLIVFMIIHIGKGLAGGNEKLILGAYVLMMLYAGYRMVVNIIDIFKK